MKSTTIMTVEKLDVEAAVAQRYSVASKAVEPALCCCVKYDPKYLEVLPAELIERDYGCGDPSRYVRAGETVLDLGSGSGKVCYIASQIVGKDGRVIGVDMNDEMLALARQHREAIGDKIGWLNVEFRKGRIQDLALDLDAFDQSLRQQPVSTVADWLAAQRHADILRQQSPMVATASVDVVLSNCVLNLVRPSDRSQLFGEVFRVLRPGGRAVISDIVSSASVPDHLRNDPELWSGCISGAFEEDGLLDAFTAAGFVGLTIVERQSSPWTVVENIEFRSVTVRAFKPSFTPLAVSDTREIIYRGPWRRVIDEDGQQFERGRRMNVSGAAFARLSCEPFASEIILAGSNASATQSPTLIALSGSNCCAPDKQCD